MPTAARVKLFREGVYLMIAPPAVLAITLVSMARDSTVFYPKGGGELGDCAANQRKAIGFIAARDAS